MSDACEQFDRTPIGAARQLVNELLAHDVRDAVLAPGSRSGPLALALHAADQQGLLRLHVRVDEREAAFLALGLAKRAHRAVPVVTTSGTAVANLHPALLEAHHASVPLMAVTADRPERLRGTGANQTTEQRQIFGPIPFVAGIDALCSRWPRHAPVHLNLEFDEPLLTPTSWDFEPAHEPAHEPITTSRGAEGATAEDGREAVRLAQGPPTVVVAGDDAGPNARILARDSGWPLLAEPSSGARNGDALVSYRLLLEHASLAGQIQRVVSFGHATLSRPVTALLGRTDIDLVHIGTQANLAVPAGPRVRFASAVSAEPADSGAREWLAAWQSADRVATEAVDELRSRDDASPWGLAATVAAALPPGGLLVAGSSNPIRDLDLVARPYPPGQQRYVMANRGLSGIDGTVSTAIGAALSRTHSRVLAFIGDLTFLHGSNGLLMGPGEPRPDLTIVVAADDGGAIFAGLEQGAPEYADAFERVFATPTGADIGALCHAFNISHRRVRPPELERALATPAGGIEVIEVPIDRFERRTYARRVSEATRAALAQTGM